MNKSERIKGLEQEIGRLQGQIVTAKDWNDSVYKLEEFGPEDKVRVFDELYAAARVYLQTFAETGYEPKDGEHYLYEALLTRMFGAEVWRVINAILS